MSMDSSEAVSLAMARSTKQQEVALSDGSWSGYDLGGALTASENLFISRPHEGPRPAAVPQPDATGATRLHLLCAAAPLTAGHESAEAFPVSAAHGGDTRGAQTPHVRRSRRSRELSCPCSNRQALLISADSATGHALADKVHQIRTRNAARFLARTAR